MLTVIFSLILHPMKNFLLLALSFVLLTSFNTEESEVQFYSGTFKDLQAKAKASGKPIFIDFYTVWCAPCKNLERFTFSDPQLAEYLKNNYQTFKVDGESLMGDGIELAQKYDVRFYPTMIIMSPQGVVLKRLSGFQNAATLLAELKQYKGVNPEPEVAVNQKTTTATPTPLPTYAAGEGLFKLTVSRQESAGFGVQLGVFGDYANVLKEAQKLDETFHRNILVNITKSADKTVFKMILGPFSTREQADTYNKELKEKENRNGLVVDLGKTGGNTVATPAPAALQSRGIVNANKKLKK